MCLNSAAKKATSRGSIQNVTASVNGGITEWWQRIVVHALAGKYVHGLSRHSRDEEKRDDCLESIQLASTNSATHKSHDTIIAQWLR